MLSIGDFAFNGTLIEEIFIPSKMIEIKVKCFSNIKRIIVSPENKKFGYIFRVKKKKLLLKNQILQMIATIFFFLHVMIKKKSLFQHR